MRGRTEAEVNALAAQLAELASRNVQQQPVYQPPAQQPTSIAPDDYVTGATLQTVGNQFLQQAQQAASPALAMAASTNYELTRQKFANEFKKYGPEIDAMISRVPKTDWSIDNLQRVVKLALVDHLDELANERALQLRDQDPALRSSGANGSTIPAHIAAPDTGLTDAQRDKLRRQGITPKVVATYAAKRGETAQQWYERAGKYGIGDATS